MCESIFSILVSLYGPMVKAAVAGYNAGGGTWNATRPPNVVIIFCDDMAYADISAAEQRGRDLLRQASPSLRVLFAA